MAIWRADASIEQLNSVQRDSMAHHLGIVLTELGPDYLRGTMPVDARTVMPFGHIHGGASVVLAETLGSVASNTVVDLRRQSCVGLEINANHVRTAPRGVIVTGTARALHLGRSSHLWGIEIVDPAGKLVCVARLTMAVLDRPPPARNA